MEFFDGMKKDGKKIELFVDNGVGHNFYLNKIAIDFDQITFDQTRKMIQAIAQFLATINTPARKRERNTPPLLLPRRRWGSNATAVRVAAAPITNTSPTGFGAVVIMDNLLTDGSNPNLKRVGRAQGMYASADMTNMSFMMVNNYVFDDERFNGSTLSVLGRNPVTSPAVRELPVVGGTGVFRFASGYAEARTFFVNETNGDAIVEYNVYVLH
ncbi:hypothetical protein E3N88_14643 [Mikania micrantha]|uniref:Dirigent protein n=1 Tax=Mikania micrantha TaxID=192012 RepID=A0A5N6P3Z4_9ASTR|nr:hypothetical protein E3N88_14643 [Mikania micrantha]